MLDNEPTAGVTGPGDDTTMDRTSNVATGVSEAAGPVANGAAAQVSPPKVTKRRRAASRPAGPPPEEAERAAGLIGPSAEPPAAPPEPVAPEPGPAAAETPETEPAGEAAQPASSGARRTRTRTRKTETESRTAQAEDEPAAPRRRRSRKAAAPEPEEERPAAARTEPEQPAEPPAAQPEPAEPVAQEQPAAQEPTGPEAGRDAQGAHDDEDDGEHDGVDVGVDDGEDATAAAQEELEEELPEEEPLDDEPVGEDVEETASGNLLADPFGLAAQAARREQEPSALFQASTAVFQPLFRAPEPFEAVKVVETEEPAAPEPDDTGEAADDDGQDEPGGRRRRRRRGGRNRRARGADEVEETEETTADEPETAETTDDEPAEPPAEEQQAEGSTGTRRRRRRRRRSAEEGTEPAEDDPPNTVVRIRAPRGGRAATSLDEVQGVRGSTRLEAKKQRRREGRELGRRRPPIITESEFLARRESVERVMVVRRHGGRTQIGVLEDGILVEHYVDREASQSYVGNVYLGKVQNVLPSMEAAFVDIGKGRNAVLYAGEVNFDTVGLEGQPKRIESALKSGQSVLVQVTKDPIGHKGARLTSQISLPGRYLVYVPDGSMTGISRKLPDKERARLKSILKKVMPENAGVIVRTAAEGASEEELSRDVARLSAQWENIQRKAKSASPPELLYSEPDMTIRVVRDVFNEDFSSLVVADEETREAEVWDTVNEYVRYVAPHLADRLTKWEEDRDVFAAYRIDEQIAKALERKVWLPSGGSLVIDRTEAMTVIDVNTGKFTGQGGNLEETVTRNNLEAAEEIVRQLRLRDIGGIIVVDFIDMVLESNRDLVLRRLLECLARDRTKHQVAEVTSLGLVQMTRKRVGQGLLEAFSTQCECCGGRGVITSTEPVDKQEQRGTQGKMAVEKAVAHKLGESGGAAVASAAVTRQSLAVVAQAGAPASDAAGEQDGEREAAPSRSRRRSRSKVKQAE